MAAAVANQYEPDTPGTPHSSSSLGQFRVRGRQGEVITLVRGPMLRVIISLNEPTSVADF